MFRIAHISDLHILSLDGVRFREFLNKRLTGGLTLMFKRRQAHPPWATERLVEDLCSQDLDHVVVTGDVTNLSLAAEFRLAKRLLEPLGGGRRLSVVPGNHDVYTGESLGRFEEVFAEQIRGDHVLPAGASYPFVKLFDGVALVGVSTAVPTPWLVASGRVGEKQLARLDAVLASPDIAPRFKIVMLHHPLRNDPKAALYRLRDLKDRVALGALLRHHEVDLVLHGHNHVKHWTTLVPEDSTSGSVHTAPSGSNVGAHSARAMAGYTTYQIDPKSGAVSGTEYRVYDPDEGRFVSADAH